jgi:hypothetical protein
MSGISEENQKGKGEDVYAAFKLLNKPAEA